MTKIIAVRHAESIANVNGIYQGQSYDTELSSIGEEQAFALAEKLADFEIDEIVSSPLQRTMQTAEAVAMNSGLDVTIDDRIIETNHGLWEGKNKIYIAKNYPEVYKTWLTAPSKAVFPEGEAFSETVQRVKDFLHDFIFSGITCVVTHDNILRIMICLAKEMPIDDIWQVKIDSASINYFELQGIDGKKQLKTLKLNDKSHLEGIYSDLEMHAL